ncbi:MAG: hypothetical protein AAF721_35795, partial [Myxococcota bacterium]
AWVSLTACRPATGGPTTTTPPAPADDDVVGDAEPQPDPPQPTRPKFTGTCGTAGLTVDTYDWIPADARAAVTIALSEADTPAALTALAAHGRAEDHGLPIGFAFGITQWPILVPVLGTLLDAVGLQPEEVVYVAPAKGPAFAWVVRSDCDLDEALARVSEAWGLAAQRRVQGVVATTPPDPNAGDGTLSDPPKPGDDAAADAASPGEDAAVGSDGQAAFPYDVVFATGGRVALVPRGYGDDFLTALSEATGNRPPPGTPDWTERLAAIEAAPIRGVLSGHALLGSRAKRAPVAMSLRAAGDAVAVDPLDEPAADERGPKKKQRKHKKRKRKASP